MGDSREDQEAQIVDLFQQRPNDKMNGSLVVDGGAIKRSLSPELGEGVELKPAFNYIPSMAGSVLHPILEAHGKGGAGRHRHAVTLYRGAREGFGIKGRPGKGRW